MNLPIQHTDYKQAVKEAGEVSVKAKDCIIYVFRKLEGGYVIDYQAGAFSNEKLVMKLLNGEAV